jgi:hypothetical protein
MDDPDKCLKCGAVYHRAPINTPFLGLACAVCGTPLRYAPTFPSQSVVVGPVLATVPGCGSFDSSQRTPGSDKEDQGDVFEEV